MGIFSALEFLEELELLGNRFLQDYGGMDEIWRLNLQFETAICLFIAGLLYLFGRVKSATILSIFIALFSIIYRFYFCFTIRCHGTVRFSQCINRYCVSFYLFVLLPQFLGFWFLIWKISEAKITLPILIAKNQKN